MNRGRYLAEVSLASWKDSLWPELFDDETGDGRPLTIIQVDDALFARAGARSGIELAERAARRAFLSAFPDRLQVQRWLAGSDRPGDALLPLLVLCCLAASEAADSEKNDYRERMREVMGWTDRIINCEALPRLWTQLAALTRKRGERVPTRELILPDPRFRTQIGHAIELTFPSRNDARRLVHELIRQNFDLDAPRSVIAWLEPLVSKGKFSTTFEEAFGSFRDAWLGAERSLRDHRFWSGWTLVISGLRQKSFTVPFEIVSDEWGLRSLIDPFEERPIDLEVALHARALPPGLVATITKSHIIPLIEGDWGRLRWMGAELGKVPSAMLIRERAFLSRIQALRCVRVAGAEGWGLTLDVVGVLGLRAITVDRDRLIDVTPIGCTRVDGGVLARPALPFLIEATGHVGTVALEGDQSDQLILEKLEVGRWRVTPRVAVAGEVRIVAEPRSGGASFERRLRLRRSILVPTFHESAPARLSDSDPEPAPHWPTTMRVGDSVRDFVEAGDREISPILLDLIEFLAVRTGPMPLGEFGAIVQSAVAASGVSQWDIIQSLRDARVIQILNVRGWRGRVILSRPPRGAITRTKSGWVLLFEGCQSETWLARLAAASARHELIVENRSGVGAWSPSTPIVVADEIATLRDIAALVEAPVGYLSESLGPIKSLYVAPSLTITERRSNRRSVPLSGKHAPLAFLDSDLPNVAPVWEVQRGATVTVWTNRDDAVLDAYVAVGERPFKNEATRWVANNARLPTHVARWIRLSLGVAAGPMSESGYGYARDVLVDRELARIAPALFHQTETSRPAFGAPPARQWRSLAVASPGGARVRPLWEAVRWTRKRESL